MARTSSRKRDGRAIVEPEQATDVPDEIVEVAPASTPAGPLLQGRYRLEETLGRGGLSTVYRATDTVLDRSVAVKLLHPNLCRDPQFVERFLDMERRIGRLFHPHLVTIFDAGVADEQCFVIMEYVAGGNLRDLLREGRSVPIADVVRIVTQVADALQVLHDEGIIHGEIKPGNILLDEDGAAKLVDFGIVHLATTTGVIRSETISGTAPYLAPEQLEHGQSDARSDLYALGVVAYELLAGRHPYQGENWIAIATERLKRDPDPLLEARPDVSAELNQAVMRALARTPDDRYRSAGELRRAILGQQSRPIIGRADAPRRAEPAPPPRQLEPRPTCPEPGPVPPEPVRDRASAQAVPAAPPVDPLERTEPVPRAPLPRGAARPADSRRPQVGLSLPAFRAPLGRPSPLTLTLLGLAGLALLLLAGLAAVLPKVFEPAPSVAVPELTGRPLEAAQNVAREAGLRVTTAEEPSESAARGTVIRQEPGPTAGHPSDRPVRLVVSSGPPPVTVPDLKQRPLDAARQDLAAVGLTLGKIEEREITSQPWNVIVDQAVKPGAELGRGGTVDVVLGTPARTNAPKLIDRPLGEAEAELDKRGLRLGAVKLEPAAGKRAGTVLAQEPAPDVALRRGETVSVTIAVPPAPAAKPQ